MENSAIILIAVLITAIILGPLCCAAATRKPKPAVYNPQDEDLKEACRKLKSVTTRSSISHASHADSRDVDLEAATPRAEFGECPVCIGPLIPEPAHTAHGHDDDDVRSCLDEVATVTAKSHSSSVVEAKEAGEAGRSNSGERPGDDDVLTLKSCGHSFHSKCLSSWFLIKRYDCPVCRVPYYSSHRRTSKALNVTAMARAWAP